MKRYAIHKKTILSVIIAVLVAIVFAVCCLPKSKRANAYDGTFYFRGDPVISATATDGRYPIRFNLIVSESALSSSDTITVTLSSNSTSAYIQRGHENTTITESEGTSQSVSFPYSVISWTDDGTASLYVDMYLNVYEKGRITATCASTSAVSDEHTVVSAIELAAKDGYSAQGGLTSSDARTLAAIYDKYAGKNTTTDKGSLSLVSNVYPKYYASSPNLAAEFEIPTDVGSLLKNNLIVDLDLQDFSNGVVGTHYIVDAKFYLLSLVTDAEDPTKSGNDDLSTGALRKNSIVGYNFGGLYNALYNEISNSTLRARAYSDISGYQPSGDLNPSNTGGMSSFDSTTTEKRSLEFKYGVYNSFEKSTPLYFYGEVIEYHWVLTYSEIGSNLTLLDSARTITSVYRSDIVNTSLQGIAENILTKNATLLDGEREAVCGWGGIDSTAERPLEVIYKTYSTSGNYETVSQIYSIGAANIYNKYAAINAMYNLTGITDITHFNIVSTRQTYDAESGMIYDMGNKILRQALDYDYVYNADEDKGYATVVYDDFLYKDFSILIQNNDLNNLLEINYYTADVTVENGQVTLIYNYADIEERLLNSCEWLFELDKEDFTVTGDSDMLIAVDIGDEELTVTIPLKYQSDLFGLNITAMIEIVPNEAYELTYIYYTDFKVSGDGKTITPITGESKGEAALLSTLKRYNNYNNFMKDHRSEIYAPIDEFETAYDVRYARPTDIRMTSDQTMKTCTITVLYQLESLFRVIDNLSDQFSYMQVSHTTNVYEGADFVEATGGEVSGYRVDKIESSTSALKVTNAYDYHDTRAVLNAVTYGGDIYSVKVVFTDKWLIAINYMSQYKDTPFLVKTRFEGEVRVADYPDIYALTSSDLAKILGRASMGVVNNKSTVDKITVTYDNIGTYTVDTTYSYMAIKKRNYNGETEGEIQVPLTCYAEWCEDYGKDWSILYLNNDKNTYFQYSNDVKREDLYGFFAVAIFEEKVSDFNYHFKDYVGDGCITFHESEEVRGSRIYKFFNGLKQNGEVIYSAIGKIGMAFCEVANDENAIYYSNFFYLDGTSADPMLSGSGSVDGDDHDGAAVNELQDLVDDVKNWWEGIKDKGESSTFGQILAIALPIIFVIVIGALVVWFLRWLFKKG